MAYVRGDRRRPDMMSSGSDDLLAGAGRVLARAKLHDGGDRRRRDRWLKLVYSVPGVLMSGEMPEGYREIGDCLVCFWSLFLVWWFAHCTMVVVG